MRCVGRTVVAACGLLWAALAGPVLAAEPAGCDKFAWDVSVDRQALAGAGKPSLQSGGTLPAFSGAAAILHLQPVAEVRFVQAPERAPKNPVARAGILQAEVPAAGLYRISLSTGAWLDVIQNGGFIKPEAFSGATACEGLRKSVKFRLGAGAVSLQLSDVTAETIGISIIREP
jgi:hypothetical protein